LTLKTLNDQTLRNWALVITIPLFAAALQLDLPAKWGGFLGDSAVYLSMADSIAHDFDLKYSKNDLVRITREWPGGPQGILLVANDNNPDIIHYAKPLLYPLLTAPLVRFLNSNGMLIFNVLCFGIILWSGFRCFPLLESKTNTYIFWTLVFWCLTTVPAYIFSLTPDLFNCAILMVSLMFWVKSHDMNQTLKPLFICAFILGLAAASRPPSGLFLLLPIWTLLVPRSRFETTSDKSLTSSYLSDFFRARLLPIVGIILIFVIGAGIVFLLTQWMTGQALAHGGFRKRIVGPMPFESPGVNFLNTGNIISTRSTKFVFHWDTMFHNLKYFFLGHFTGLIPYFFPAVIAMIMGFPVRSKNSDPQSISRGRLPVWIVCAGLVLFHLIYIPTNYHGGSCAVGNRYLISFIPAFFLLLKTPPKLKTLLAITLITAIFTGPIALNPIDSMAHYRDASKRVCFHRFPPEITLLNSWPIDDSRHVRVEFPEYFIYFADDNQWGKELNGFWVKGKSRTSLVLRCWKPVNEFRVSVKNGGVKNRLMGKIGKSGFQTKADPSQSLEFNVKPGKPVLFYNLNGDPSYCYNVYIQTADGFIPRFTEPGSTDSRFLGCFIEIKINS